MEKEIISQIIAACSGLSGSLIGAFGSYFVTKKLSIFNRNNEKVSIESSLATEALSIYEAWEMRELLDMFKTFLEPSNFNVQKWPMPITRHVPQGLGVIYKANISKIGDVNPELAINIIQLHQMANAIEQMFMAQRQGHNSYFTDQDLVRIFNFLSKATRFKENIERLKPITQ